MIYQWSTILVDRVVSTKLSEDDLGKLMEACKKHQCTTSKLVKLAITKWIESENSKKEGMSVQLKATPHDMPFEEKHLIKDRKETSVDEAYFQYFRARIDAGKCVESR